MSLRTGVYDAEEARGESIRVIEDEVRLRERDYTIKQRRKMAKRGQAMKDGTFPIRTAVDLRNAIRLAGNAKNPRKARRFIMKRAAALGLSDRVPSSWEPGGSSGGGEDYAI